MEINNKTHIIAKDIMYFWNLEKWKPTVLHFKIARIQIFLVDGKKFHIFIVKSFWMQKLQWNASVVLAVLGWLHWVFLFF